MRAVEGGGKLSVFCFTFLGDLEFRKATQGAEHDPVTAHASGRQFALLRACRNETPVLNLAVRKTPVAGAGAESSPSTW